MERMKKIFILLCASLFISNAFSQSKELTDTQLKDILVTKNTFGEYLKCNSDNTFISSYRTNGGDGYEFEGKYKIQNGIITFSDVKGTDWANKVLSTDNNGNLNLNSKFRYLSDKNNGTNQGCLYDINDKSYFWSVKTIPENMIIEINGIKAYKVVGELYITENLKMRDKPSLKSNVVEVQGCDFRCNGWVESPRKIVFKGMVINGTKIAKTVEQDTIDGITAPWYYILQQDHDPLDRNEGDEHYVWIFGGYVKEYPENAIFENPQEIQKSVESVGLKFKQYNNTGDKS